MPEWIGANENTPVPPRVRLRVFERDSGRCQCGCNRRILAGESWQTDHRKALVNKGTNRESNLCTLLTEHHKSKTKQDVAEKSKSYRVRLRDKGIRTAARPMPGSKASPFKKRMDGTVERR